MAEKKTSSLVTHLESLGNSKSFQKNIANRSFLRAFKKFLKGSTVGAYVFTEATLAYFLTRPEHKKHLEAYNMSKYSTALTGPLVLRKDLAHHG